MTDRILLSGPDVGEAERLALLRAFDSGWIAPVGPDLDAFEAELKEYTGAEGALALASGTAALHLALLIVGVQPGDEVFVQTATFAASAFAVMHAGATPVFIDVERRSWCMDPDLLESALAERARRGRLPASVMPVDLYGATPDMEAIRSISDRYGIPVIEDGAEGLGSRTVGGMAGTLGRLGALSFNGNKVMTTSGGGALLGSPDDLARARHLATQAREPVLHYEHEAIGFNYRMSNLLAALGRAQLSRLESMIEARTATREFYEASLPELEFCPAPYTERPNHWLSVGLLPDGVDVPAIWAAFDAANIEARPFWKPMHRQPVFAEAESFDTGIADELFRRGICLPSGSGLTQADRDRVVAALRGALEAAR